MGLRAADGWTGEVARALRSRESQTVDAESCWGSCSNDARDGTETGVEPKGQELSTQRMKQMLGRKEGTRQESDVLHERCWMPLTASVSLGARHKVSVSTHSLKATSTGISRH